MVTVSLRLEPSEDLLEAISLRYVLQICNTGALPWLPGHAQATWTASLQRWAR